MLKSPRTKPLSSKQRQMRGQSLLELALVLPILILILMGLVETAIFIGRYLDALDLTREAARFASGNDPNVNIDGGTDSNGDGYNDLNCSANQTFFYYTTSCIFSPPTSAACISSNNPFCNGMNAYLAVNPETDDVLISVYTIGAGNEVIKSQPSPSLTDPRIRGSSFIDSGGLTSYYWALSDHDTDTVHNGNWQKDCRGNVVLGKTPYYSNTRVQAITQSTSLNNASGTSVASPGTKGYVAVEFYFCYTQALGLPVFTTFVPNPMMIHAYTLMPLPNGAPTPTPIP